jgi:hypothetical protein
MVESSGVDAFVSSLGKGREAFHSEVTEYCLRIGERSPEDFLRKFSCTKLMLSLAARPMERARIISQLTGVHERVAHKLSPENAGETLQIALDEGVTTPKDIVRLFQPDDRQRYLNRHELWAFDVEGEPWKASPNDVAAHGRAEKYIAYILERAIQNLLISQEDIVSGLGVVKLAGWLPSELLGQIIEASLKKSEKFTEEDLLRIAPPASLTAHVPLDYIWEKVVVPLIAEQHDYAPKKGEAPIVSTTGPQGVPTDGWSLRPGPESKTGSGNNDEGDLVDEDEIIETEDEVSAPEGTSPGVRNSAAASAAKKVN